MLGMLVAAALAAAPVRADIVIPGAQHVGDTQSATFTPVDPLRRDLMRSFPTLFHLSQTAVITALRLDGVVSQDQPLEAVYVDDVAVPGTASAGRWTFAQPRSLSPGFHTVAVRPGCLQGLGPLCFNEDDIGWTSLTLLSAQTSSSLSLGQRHHVGDDDDDDDDYDPNPTLPRAWYPDRTEGNVVDMPFSLTQNRVLTEVRLFRVRDVDVGNGSVNVVGPGVNARVGAVSGNAGELVLPTTLALSAGTYRLRVVAGDLGGGNRDSFSWDGAVLQFSAAGGSSVGRFNAVDPGADAVTGALSTRVAGAAFALDVTALNLAGSGLQADYSGTVSVELLDARDDGGALDAYGCRASWSAAQSLGSLTFAAANGGRRTLTATHANALRVARLRMTDTDTGVRACSADAFALRPADFDVSARHANALNAGTAEALDATTVGAGPTHRAGQPFTVQAVARTAAGAVATQYDGTPALAVQSPLLGAVSGTLVNGNWFAPAPGERRTDTARYAEAGAFVMLVSDTQFADVDAADTPLAQRQILGSVSVGRFTPDHFQLVSRNVPAFAPGCGRFGYLGQAFGYDLAPEALIEAVNAGGVRTLNYEGALYRLPATLGASTYRAVRAADTPVPLDTALLPAPDHTVLAQGQGLVRLAYDADARLAVQRQGPLAPFDVEIELLPPPIVDDDGIVYADPTGTPLQFGTAAPGAGIAFTGAAKQQQFGRGYVRNAYGSELVPLDVPYGVESFGINGGFARNLADACSVAGAVTLDGALSAQTAVVGSPGPLVAGQGTVRLSAPGAGAVGSVTVTIGFASWLGTDTDGDGVYAEPAQGQASFGRFREADQQIYWRETYR